MRPMDGYPDSWGSKRVSVIPHAGPASYVQVTEGVAPAVATGGDTLDIDGESGVKFGDIVLSCLTDSAKYRVEAIPTTGSGQTPFAQPCATFTLRWEVVATGAQVAAEVDLSDEIVRLLVVGPK